jgi:hypothetical protein
MSDPVQGNGVAGVPPPKKKRSNAWIWYFIVLAVLTVMAAGALIAFNLGQQLRPEQLEAARRLWERNGPANYNLDYQVRRGDCECTDEITVQVRQGKVIAVTDNGLPLERDKFRYYGMPALFDDIERFLEEDGKPNKPRTFARARFDPQDGHLLEYVRRVMGARPIQRVEIHVERFEALP